MTVMIVSPAHASQSASQKTAAESSSSRQADRISQVIVIDSRVEFCAELIWNIKDNLTVYVLADDQDGLQQITEILHRTPDVSQLYCLAHGETGGLTLGATTIRQENLCSAASEISQWFAPHQSAEIHLYACHVADGAEGRAFVETLHHLSGASVIASTHAIGSLAQGGTWQLDYQIGSIEGSLPIDSEVLATYPGLLADPLINDIVTITRSTSEDIAQAITGISISDGDGNNQTVTVAVADGTITLATTANLTVSNNGTGTVTLSGALADINAALNGMVFTPLTNFADRTTLTISTNDGSSTVSRAIDIDVTPVNDAPTIAPSAPSVAEGGQVSFTAGNFGIVDTDNLDVQVIVKITQMPEKGYLTLGGSRLVIGSTFSYDQIGSLQYHHDGTQTTVAGGTSDSFVVSVDDGAGGVIPTATIPITITPVNQLPSVTSTNVVFEGEVNYPVQIAIQDVDQTAANFTIKITSLPADGVLKLSGNAVTLNQILSSADLANLTYTHDGNDANNGFPPDVSFNVEVIDDGGGTGVPGTTTAQIDLKLRPNNDDPILAQNTGLAYNTSDSAAGGFTRLITADLLQVTDVDSATTQLTYMLTAIPDPSVGTLQVNRGSWQILGNGTTFTQQELDQGLVRYVFHKNATGVFNDSFSFTVRDGELRSYPSVREGGIWQPDGSALQVNTFNLQITTLTGGPGGTYTPDITDNVSPYKVVVGTATGLEAQSGIAITKAMLEYADPDNTPSEIVYRVMELPTSGVIRVNGQAIERYGSFTQQDINDGKVTFSHGGAEDFLDGFTFTVSDGRNVTVEEIFRFDITPQNDTPVVTVKGSPALAEGGTITIGNTALTMGDVDGSGEKSGIGYATPNNLTFKVVNLPAHGKLEVDQGTGFVEVTAGTVLTKAQLDGNKLRYVHNGSENFADSFSVQANDNTTGTSNNLSNIQTIQISIASLNDAPSSLSVKSLTVAEGGTGLISGSSGIAANVPHLVYEDPDNTTIQRQYRITNAVDYGVLLLNGKALAAGSVFTQSDLDAGRISYRHNGTEQYSDRFEFTVSDGGGTSVPGSYDIVITPDNDAPTLTVPGLQAFATATPLTFSAANGNRIVVGDIDLITIEPGEADILKITLDLQAAGVTYTGSTLTLGNTSNLTITAGSSGTAGGKITFTGTLADVQKALDGLQVQVPTDEDRTLNLVVTVDDLLNGLAGAPAPTGIQVTKSIALNTSNVNDPATITKPANVTVNEDAPFSFTGGNAISIADVDNFGAANNTVTLSVTNGNLTLTNPSLITGGANNSSTITLTGSLTAINSALAGLSYQGNSNYNGNDTLAISFNDQGNLGGAAQIVNQNIPIVVQPINDAPTLVAPTAVQTIANTNPLIFSTAQGNGITIDDLADLQNNGADTFSVTLTATSGSNAYGTLTAATGSGATITGSGANITIAGTKAQVNAALNGLSYTPTDYNSEATVNLVVEVNDLANGGTGALTASKTITINTSDINNAPIVTKPASIAVNEDAQFTFAGANLISIDDPDDFGGNLQVSLSVAQGKLTLGSTNGITIKSGSNNSAAITIEGTEAAINTALNNLKYQGNSDFNGPDTLNLQVNDLGNTGSGGSNIVNQSISITVNPINDAPTRSASAVTLTSVSEDPVNPVGASITSLFNPVFVDSKDNKTALGGSAANSLAGIAITANAANETTQGKWQWFDGTNWQNIPDSTSGSAPSTSSAFVLAANTLVRFLPNANFNGTPGGLTVRLIDDSSGAVVSGSRVNVSTSGGTTQYSNSSNAVTLGTSITAVNDAPIASGNATLAAIDEDTANPAGDTITNLFNARFNDATDQVLGGSNANTLAGIAIISNPATTEGTWQYYNGSSWQAVGSRSSSNALIIKESDKLRFVPAANYNGTPPELSVHLIDSSIGSLTTGSSVDLSVAGATGGTTAYSAVAIPLNTTVNPVNDTPSFSNLGGNVSYTENAAAILLDGNATVQDIELGGADNWNGATLTLGRSSGANSQDVFGNSGTLSSLSQSGNLTVDGTTIGTVTTNSGGQLLLTFNSSATTALVNSALQQITYRNNSEDPPSAVTISYTLNDGNTGAQGSGGAKTASGSVVVNITPLNDAPGVLAGGSLAYTENQAAKVIDSTVTLGDVDDTQIASATATISSGFTTGDILAAVTTGTNITATYDSNTGVLSLSGIDSIANYQQVMRAVTYRSSSETPTQTSNSRTITWQVIDANSDGAGAQSSSPVTSTITVNALPDPVNDSFATSEDTAVNGTVADVDPGELTPTYSISTGPAKGTVSFNADGSFTYTPNADFNGTDSFVYKVTDGNGDFANATATIVINPVQDIQNDADTTKEDTAIDINVLANDSFESSAVVSSVSQGADGTVTINPNGTVKYTPNANFTGTDSFTYTATAGGVSETATVTVTVDPVPDAVDDVFATDEDTLINGTVADADPGDKPAVYALTDAPDHGSLQFNADGSFTYTPNDDFHGTDSFTYEVTDANGDKDTAIATITVNPVRDTQTDSATTDEDTAVEIDVLGNDTFEPGASVTSITQGQNGTVSIGQDGKVTYTPDDDFHGTDSFTYTVTTAAGNTETETVNITVEPVQDTQTDSATTDEDTAVEIDVLGNDTFEPGASVTGVTQGQNGTVSIGQDGKVTYTPDDDFHGTDSFTYTVTTAAGNTETETVNITVDPVQDTQTDSVTTDEDTAVEIDVLGNDTFEPGASVTSITQGNNGTVSIGQDGTVTYTPDDDFHGTDSFTYTVTTAAGNTETETVNITVDPVQDTQTDSATTDEDTAVEIDVLGNDTFEPGASVTSITQGNNGTVSIGQDGTVTYTPDDDFHGTDSFTYTVTTAAGNLETETVNITVDPIQDTQTDSATTDEDTAVEIDVLGNDTFEPGASVTGVTQGQNGTVSIGQDGTVTYTPDDDFHGTDSFTYTVTTAAGNTETETVNVTVEPIQDTQTDSATTDEDTAVEIDVLGNDTFEPDASITSVTQGNNGTVSIGQDGTVTYTPDDDFHGTDSFTYTVTTAAGNTETETVNVTVDPVQDTQTDSATTDEDTAVEIDVLGNDTFEPGATVTSVTQGQNGTVSIGQDGTVTYTPDDDFHGTDSFTYTVTTAAGNTETETVNITVDPVQDTQTDSATTDEDTAVEIDVLGNDTFEPGASVTGVTQGQNGTVSIGQDGTVTYTPDDDFHGTDSFTYTVTTAAGNLETETVNVTVDPIQDTQTDSATIDEDTAVEIDVLGNDSFEPGASVTGVTQGQNGTVSIAQDGTVTYTPDDDFHGTDSFTYTVTTAAGNTETETVNVTVEPVQDTQTDSATTDEDTAVEIDVLGNDSFEPGASVTGVTQGQNGTVSIAQDGKVIYTPDDDFHGTDSFTYTVTTAAGNTETETVNITVEPIQDTQTDSATTDEDTAVEIDVLGNDTFEPGATVTSVTQGNNGTVSIGQDGTVTYTPDDDFHGTDSFTYTVTTAAGNTETETVNITVDPVQDTQTDSATTDEDTAVEIDVLGNDTFEPGATVTSVTQGNNGTVSIAQDGKVTYTPDDDFHGTDSFTYTVTTAAGNTETETVNITVDPVQDTQSDSAITDEDTAVEIDVLGNDTFEPGASVTSVTQGNNGTVSIGQDGKVTYTPDDDFHGTDSFTYTVTTAAGNTETETVTVTVDPVQDTQSDSATTDEDTTVEIDVLGNDSFEPGATVTGVTQGQNGTVSIAQDGKVTYTPDDDFHGTDSFTYTVTTAAGNTETETVNITVDPVQDTQTDSATTDEDTAVEIDVLGNDTFEPGASVTSVTQGNNGTVSIAQDGTVTYTPDDDFHGTDSFTYTVTTAAGNTETETVNITVDSVQDTKTDFASTDEDTAVEIDVLSNDTFEPGAKVTNVTQGQNGTVSIGQDGKVIYTPKADFHGADSFTYTVTTAAGNLETETVNVTVTPVQDTQPSDVTTDEDIAVEIDVLGNSSFEPGAKITEVTQGNNGTVSIAQDGKVTYTPNADFYGTDSFTYTVTTSAGDLETETVTVTVDPVIDIQNDQAVTNEDQAVEIDVLNNDSFQPGATIKEVTAGSNGSVAIQDGKVIYTPNPDFYGSDSFTYTVKTAAGNTETATVQVTVNPIQDIQDDTAITDEDTPIEIDVLANDSFDPGAQITDVTPGKNGFVSITQDGKVIYTPNPDFYGSDSFTYTVTSGNATETATVSVTVNPIADAQDDTAVTDEDTALEIDVLSNDSFQPGATISQVTQGKNGSVSITQDGKVIYTPNPDFYGSDSFTYTVKTAAGDTETATANITVNPTKDIRDDAAITDEDTPIKIDVLANDSFDPGVTITEVSLASNGSVTIGQDGKVLYTPQPDFHGTDSFTYTVTTAAGNQETATVNITVNPIRDAENDRVTLGEDAVIDIDVLTNDRFAPGAIVTEITQGQSGLVTINPDNTVRYVPRADFYGSDRFTYTVTTAAGNTETATVEVTVEPVVDITPDRATTNEDEAIDIDVLINDRFKPGAQISQVTQGKSGRVTINPNGTITYAPNPDFYGSDRFTYTVTSGGVTETTEVEITVNPVQGAVPDRGRTLEGTPVRIDVLSNDDFIGTVQISEVSPTPNGQVSINTDGTLTYIPNRGFRGTDQFTYRVRTAGGKIETAEVTIDVLPDANGDGIADGSDLPTFLSGSQGSDQVTGTSAGDVLNGFSDLDVLRGGSGNDIINGGSDADLLYGDEGDDTINGGSNNDYMDGGSENDILNGGTGNDQMFGQSGDDILNGGPGRDRLSGGTGNDRISGNGGNDRLMGDEGDDWLVGGRGNDRLIGGAGQDKLTGGQGRDRFIYLAPTDLSDEITDFEILKDRFELKQLFKGSAGSMQNVRFKQRRDDTLVQVNLDGWRNLATLKDVNADTLSAKHFVF